MDKELYIRFTAPVTAESSQKLHRLLDQANRKRTEVLHLLLSSPGGSVNEGITLYNYLKALPITVHTYNIGLVDSIATAIFCAGDKRHSAVHARFQLHPVIRQQRVPMQWDAGKLQEAVNTLEVDQINIARIICGAVDKSSNYVLKLIHKRTTLLADRAHQMGLVQDFCESFIPRGVQVLSVDDRDRRQVRDSAAQEYLGFHGGGSHCPALYGSKSGISNSVGGIISDINALHVGGDYANTKHSSEIGSESIG